VSSNRLCLAGPRKGPRICTGLLSICLLENTHNLGIKFREFEFQHGPVRMEDQVAPRRQLVDVPPQYLAQPPLDAIALMRRSKHLPHCESDARTSRLTLCGQKPAH